MAVNSIIQNASIEVVLDTTDIGGTNATSKYVDMTNFGSVAFIVQLGMTLEGTADNWHASDQLDGFKLLQATDAAATGSKDITGAANVSTAVEAAGNILAIEIHTPCLDMDNDFNHVAAYVSEAGNSGVDAVTIVAVRYNPRFAHKDLTTDDYVIV